MNSNVNRSVSKSESDKLMIILQNILKDEDNRYCVDCDAKAPRWASWNLGVFLCIRCAGIHRNLGVHISKVKSVNLDSWTPEQVAYVKDMGNSKARAIYEANIPDNFRRPQTDAALEQFIRAKYEHHKYIAREWRVPPKPNVESIMKELSGVGSNSSRSVSKKPVTVAENRDSTSLTKAPSSRDSSGVAKVPPAVMPGIVSATVPTVDQNVAAVDLLGLHTPISSTTKPTTPVASLSADDLFGDFTGATTQSPPISNPTSGNSSAGSNNGLDFNIFNNNSVATNTVPSASNSNGDSATTQTNTKSTKESILALYGNSTSSALPVQNQWEPSAQQLQFLGVSGTQQVPLAASNPYAILGTNQYQDGNQLFGGGLQASANNQFATMPSVFNGVANGSTPAYNNPFFTPQPQLYHNLQQPQTAQASFGLLGHGRQDEMLRQHALGMNQQAAALQQQQQQAYLAQIQSQLSGMQLSSSSTSNFGMTSSVSLGNLAAPVVSGGGNYNVIGSSAAGIGGAAHTASATNLWQ